MWIEFIREKSDTFTIFESLCRHLCRENGKEIGKIISIRNDYGREFENSNFSKLYTFESMVHEFSAQSHLNKMEFSSITNVFYKRLLELCFMPRIFRTIFQLKQ